MPRKSKTSRKGAKTTQPSALGLSQKRIFNNNQTGQSPAGPNPVKGQKFGGRPPMFPGRQGGR